MSEEVSIDVNDLFGGNASVQTDEPETAAPEEVNENPVDPEADQDKLKHFEVNPKMYVYFDMEFTSLVRDADLLSIGLCDAEGHSFYAEFNDFNFTKVTPWVFENVLQRMTNPSTQLEGDHWAMKGNTKEIRMNLIHWLEAVHKHSGCGIQFVTDCGHYDMVFLIDLLWKEATTVPEWISPVACDINNDLANITYQYNINLGSKDGEAVPFNPYHDAFNLNRDEYASKIQNAPKGMQHNSMYDAYVTRAIHQNIWEINLDPTPLCEVPLQN